MPAPAWIERTLRVELDDDVELEEADALEEGAFSKLAIATTSDGAYVVRDTLFSSDVYPIELDSIRVRNGRPRRSRRRRRSSDEADTADDSETTPETETSETEDEPESIEEPQLSRAPFGRIYEIEEIEGIGETYGTTLRKHGIATTQALHGADTDKIAEALDVSRTVVNRWRSMAELMAVTGIGSQYAELLARAGVESVPNLADRTPSGLLKAIEGLEDSVEVNIQGNRIGEGMTERWIGLAQDHDPDEAIREADPEPDEPTPEDPGTTPSVGGANGGGRDALTRVGGIGPSRAARLAEIGVEDLRSLVEADTDKIAEALDVSTDQVSTWQRRADLTAISGIGAKRTEQLHMFGLRTLRDLVLADPSAIAEAVEVNEGTVVDWQQAAIEVPGFETDLLEVDGVGASRARTLFRMGIEDARTLADVNTAKVAERLSVSESTVETWQQAARDR